MIYILLGAITTLLIIISIKLSNITTLLIIITIKLSNVYDEIERLRIK